MVFPFHCNTVPCTKPKWIKQGWLLRNLNSDYLLVPYIWLKFLLQETEKSKLWINYKVFANTYWNFKMLQVHQGVQKHVLPSTLGSCWHIWEPHCWSRESTHHHQTMKMKASPPWSLAQPFPEEREARRQLQLGRNTYDPSLHILPPYVVFPKTVAKNNRSCADLSVLAVPAHSQIQPLHLPYPRVWQKREDPKVCEKASAEGTALPRIWGQMLLYRVVLQDQKCVVCQSRHWSGTSLLDDRELWPLE